MDYQSAYHFNIILFLFLFGYVWFCHYNCHWIASI